MSDLALAKKYNVPVPRYTSYPTVPFWKEGLDASAWLQNVRSRFAAVNSEQGISLYIHLPFCESLCVYCGCNKKITTNHKVEDDYLEAIFREWALYTNNMSERPLIREIHLGGGTPTFFSPEHLDRLISGLLSGADVHPDHAFSIEGHPNNTTKDHLSTLHKLGFRRISYGVQDLNPEVQERIHRIQPFENLQRATEDARAVGFSAVNFDLIYGLPLQFPDRLRHTITQSASLRPDRLAFYSYAHTPWINDSQRLIDERELPSPEEKLRLYELGKNWLEDLGYTNIGMDHFALKTDELHRAWKRGKLHRNFMGYTTQNSGMLLGLGVSSISDSGTGFAQNNKALAGYYRSIRDGELAIKKGYLLNEEDIAFRQHILDIACRGYTRFDPEWHDLYAEWSIPTLYPLVQDGIVTVNSEGVFLTPEGRPFLRNVAKAFDLHLLRDEKLRGDGAIQPGKVVIAENAPGATSPRPGSKRDAGGNHPRFSNAV